MEENNANIAQPMNAGTGYVGKTFEGSNNGSTRKTTTSGVPAKVSIWSKIKQFLCQDVTVELTPKQEKAFKDLSDFWHQDVTHVSAKDFWLQKIEITL